MQFCNAQEIQSLLKLPSKPFSKKLPMNNGLESFVSLSGNTI